MDKVDFSLSASSLNTYRSSQLLFYYTYVQKSQPDTPVVQCYGRAGSCVHDLLERYSNKEVKEEQLDKEFDDDWINRNLHELKGFNGMPLDKETYRKALYNGKQLLDNVYSNTYPEESIEYELYENHIMHIRLKGIIDLRADQDGKKVLVDWKTSSSVDDSGNFRLQGLHYAMLVYKKHGYVVDEVIFEYIKINDRIVYKFTEDEIIEYEEYIKDLAEEIGNKGLDINKYEIGDEQNLLEDVWNAHKKKCYKEIERRSKGQIINITIKNNRLIFNNLPNTIKKLLKTKYTYYVPGFRFMQTYKTGAWNGKKSIVLSDYSIPYPLLNDFKEMIKQLNKDYNTNYKLVFDDQRNEKITSKIYDTEFENQTDIEMRDYQNDAVATAIEKKVGILYLGTGSGKSLIAAELIKRLNRRTLFLVNRIELATQTREVFEDFLGVEIGEMTEGNLDVKKQITIASIQTVNKILDRKDETSKELMLYLHNVTLCIFDECQNLSDFGMYGKVSKKLSNIVYSVGLSGSPWRVS